MAHAADSKDEYDNKQRKTFSKWCNNHLSKKGMPLLTNVVDDFEDGSRLMQLVHSLYGLPMPKYNTNPKARPQKLDNIALALRMLDDAKVKTNFLKREHLIDKDLKMLLGMLWSIILDYAIKGISVEEMTAKEGLLLWCRKKTQGYRDVDPPSITNFTTNWNNGMAICALIHRHHPELLDYNSLDKNNAAANIELGLKLAEQLGIPRLVDVEDLNCPRPDERSVMTYISEFFHRFASQDIKEGAARRVGRFLDFHRKIDQLQHDYEERARKLVGWVESQLKAFADVNFGETLDDAKKALAGFKDYLVQQKPKSSVDKLDLEALFVDIQTQLKVNLRKPYAPPADLTPDAIDAAFDKLALAEKERGKAVRENRFKFVTKIENKISQDKLNEFEASFKHFDADNSGKLDRTEFRAALSANGVPFKDDAGFEAVFNSVSGGESKVSKEQYMAYLVKINEDKDTPEQIKASFQMLADQGDKVSLAQLKCPPLTDDDAKYLTSKTPDLGNGTFDYKALVDSLFQ